MLPPAALARARFSSSRLRHALVALRLEEAEGQVLDLPLDLPDAQAVGQRREDLHRLCGECLWAGLLARREPAQASAAARPGAAAPPADRARRPAASCARARSAAHAARHPPAQPAPRAGSAPACACGSRGWRTTRRRPWSTTSSGAAGSRRRRPGRPRRASTARRRCRAGSRPRRRHAPARLRRCRAAGRPAAARRRRARPRQLRRVVGVLRGARGAASASATMGAASGRSARSPVFMGHGASRNSRTAFTWSGARVSARGRRRRTRRAAPSGRAGVMAWPSRATAGRTRRRAAAAPGGLTRS